MKKKLVGFLGAGALVLVFSLFSGSTQAGLNFGGPVVSLPEEDVLLGVYDPNQAFRQAPVGIEQVFISWRRNDAREFTSAVEGIRQGGRLPLVTIEPWPFEIYGLTQRTLLKDIVNGRYDRSIRLLAQAAAAQSPQVILMRWGHEMELTGLYPWSQKDPEGYISAYRHFVEIFREEGTTNVQWVWSPAGNRSCQLYWPGAEYVDFIGVATLASEEWDRNAGFVETRSFATLMREKYRNVQEYGKPIIAAEVGVSMSDPESESAWLVEAVESLGEFPKLKGWVYFNAYQSPNAFGVDEHWELNKHQIPVLMGAWNQDQ